MTDPPILPKRNASPSENPFAPSFTGSEVDRSIGKSHLDSAYWIAFATLLVGSFMFSQVGIPLGWVGVLVSLAAAIRVPLLQRRNPPYLDGLETTRSVLPPPIALFFTSLALIIIFVVVSFIAFAAICIPGAMTFGFGDESYPVLTVSGAVGLFCFCSLFALSLKLRF